MAGTAVIAHVFGPEAAIGFRHIAFGKAVYLAMLVPFIRRRSADASSPRSP